MHFGYSEETQEMQRKLHAFMDEHIIPRIRQWNEEVYQQGNFPVSFMEDLKALAKEEGLWNLFLPHLRYDEPGTPLTNLEYAPLAEIMGRVFWSSEVFNCSAPDTGNMELLHLFATPEQRERWLKPLLNGEIRSAFAMTEPDVASSDATNITTSIVRDGDEYVINGRKWFISNADHPNCKLFIVMGKTDFEAERHRQQSMILVPKDAPGVTIVRNPTVLNHFSPEGHCEMTFRNVRVPVSNILGGEGEGFAMAQARLGPGRIHHCMRAIGQAELALDLMVARSQERKTFGKYLYQHGQVAESIARSRMEIDQARLLVLKAAWMMDEVGNKGAAKEIAMIKAAVPEVLAKVADRAMQVFGGMGFTSDTPLVDLYTHGRILQVADGPDQVHQRSVAMMEIRQSKDKLASIARFLTPPERL